MRATDQPGFVPSPPKNPPAGKAYACPHCGRPLTPHDGPWDVLHCFPCNRSVDLWYDAPPALIDAPPPESPTVTP